MNGKITLAAGLLLILLVGAPTAASLTAQSSQTISAEAPAAADAAGAPAANVDCAQQAVIVAKAKDLIMSKWAIAAARAKDLGASAKDIDAAKTILLSSAPAPERQAKLVTLYMTSSLNNLSPDDLTKVDDVVAARQAYESALADATRGCPASFNSSGAVTSASPTTPDNPMTGGDEMYHTPQSQSPTSGHQVIVVPNTAPETGDGTLA